MDNDSSSPYFGKFDENMRAIELFLEGRKARRKAGLLVREGPPEDSYLRLDERLKEFQTETRLAFSEIRDELRAFREQMATKAELASLREQMATKTELASLREATTTEFASLRERMATRAELESGHDDIRMVAEGFADVRKRLDDVAGLLRLYLTAP